MKPMRVLTLVHKHLVPPETPPAQDADATSLEWKMEWDVVSTLKSSGHELLVIGVDDDLTPIRQSMEEFKPTIVFNLMEAFADIGVFDQNVVSYLELLRAPYTGCNPRGLTLSRDKALAKKLMAYHRIPVPDFTVVPRNRKPVLPRKLGFPLIVKSLLFESSTGISQASVVANEEQLIKRVQFIHDSVGTAAIVERFVDGRELYVGVLGNDRLQVLPVWEMSFAKMPEHTWHIATERVKWNASYQKKHGIETLQAPLTPEEALRVQHVAKRVYRALDLSGYARIDFRLGVDGKLFVIEANANPQLAQGEDFAESAKRGGLEYGPLLDRIMALGLQWQPSRMGAEFETKFDRRAKLENVQRRK
jgi:D-alanine-D-alanine ligase